MKRICLVLLLATFCTFWGMSSGEAARVRGPKQIHHIELALVIDKSGSMAGLESDTIGGFNAMIEKEKKLDATVNVTAVLFNDQADLLYDRKDIRAIRPMTEEDYTAGGTTALLDAVGNTILKVSQIPNISRRDTKVIFVIITDGLENASKEFTKAKIKQMISDRQEKDGWDFIYLGANIDAEEEAEAIGVDRDLAVTYKNTPDGVRANYEAIVGYMEESLSASDEERGHWKDQVEKDDER